MTCQCEEPSDSTGVWWGRATYTTNGDEDAGISGLIVIEGRPTFVEACCRCSADTELRSIFAANHPDRIKSIDSIGNGPGEDGPFPVLITRLAQAI